MILYSIKMDWRYVRGFNNTIHIIKIFLSIFIFIAVNIPLFVHLDINFSE